MLSRKDSVGEEQLAITAHFPSEGSKDQTEVDHSKDPDRAAAMLHKIQEQATLGLESDSEDDFVNDEETKAICALFDVDHTDLDFDDLDSINDDNEESIGGESPLIGYHLLVTDDNINSIDDNDEESIGGKPRLAPRPKEDDLSVNNTIPDLPCEVSLPCTRKYKPVPNLSINIENSSIGFQFTELETTTILEHFHNKPHLKLEMQAPPTKPYDTSSTTHSPSMSWNTFAPCLSLFILGWNFFTHYLELFFLSVLIKLVESSIFSMLSLMYSSIGLLELVDRICDALCPPCYYFLHPCNTTVVGMLPNPSVSFYG